MSIVNSTQWGVVKRANMNNIRQNFCRKYKKICKRSSYFRNFVEIEKDLNYNHSSFACEFEMYPAKAEAFGCFVGSPWLEMSVSE
ncbi:hypothetical protein D7D25_02150 [Proteiniphilum sp. X52]|nr:hypothetical protein D7D25_02150 [Proteiniphilum sp. X52]